MQVDLHRRKQELLDKQLQQQRVLIERLEKNKSTIKTDERAAVMQTVRNLQETIEKLKKERKHLVSERDKNKARIQKLIQRKGKFDSGTKTCKNCHFEF